MADQRVRTIVKIADPVNDREAFVTASNELNVIASAQPGVDIGDVDVLSVIPGVGANDLGKAENVLAVTADTGVAALVIQDDVLAGSGATDGDYVWMRTNSDGALWTQDVGVDAALAGSELQVDIVAELPAGSQIIGLVGGDEVDNASVSVGGSVIMNGLVFDDITPVVVTEGDAGYQRMSADREAYTITRDAAGNERGANVTGSFELNVLASAQPGVDIGDVTIADGPTGASSLSIQGTAADGAAAVGNPVLVAGEEAGGNAQSLLVDANGRLQIDVISGGGETVPVGEAFVYATSSDTASGSSLNVDTASEDTNTKKLRGFSASASVPIKCELVQMDNDVETPLVTLFGQAGIPVVWEAPHRDYFEVTFGSTAGFDGFRLIITNMDTTDAADLYGTIYSED